MKLMKMVLGLAAATLLLGSKSAMGSPMSEQFLKGWSASPHFASSASSTEPFVIAESHGNGDCLSPIISGFFEPKNLDPKAHFVCEIGHSNNDFKVVGSGSPSDRFYCEQALWEANPYIQDTQFPSSLKYDFAADAKGCSKFATRQTFFDAHPELEGKVVAMRIIPACAVELFPVQMAYEELYGLTNLRPVKLSAVESSEMNKFRLDWQAFFVEARKKTIERADILRKAGEIMDRHQSLFAS